MIWALYIIYKYVVYIDYYNDDDALSVEKAKSALCAHAHTHTHTHNPLTHTHITRNPQCRLSGYIRTDIRDKEEPWTKRCISRAAAAGYNIKYYIIIIRYTE